LRCDGPPKRLWCVTMSRSVRSLLSLTQLIFLLLLVGCGGGSGGLSGTGDTSDTTTFSDTLTKDEPLAQPAAIADVVFDTNYGEIGVVLNAAKAPVTVDNFYRYLDSGFYDGTVFHRVINGFMIQGGGFNGALEQKETAAPIVNEADNGLNNTRYTIAMARTSVPNSATSQFFINVADNAFLDYTSPTTTGWGYAVFGEVVSGMAVVDRIAGVATVAAGPFAGDVPAIPVVIYSVSRVE